MLFWHCIKPTGIISQHKIFSNKLFYFRQLALLGRTALLTVSSLVNNYSAYMKDS